MVENKKIKKKMFELPKIQKLRFEIEYLQLELEKKQEQLVLLLRGKIDYGEKYQELLQEFSQFKTLHKRTLATMGEVLKKFDIKKFPYSLTNVRRIDGCGADLLILDVKKRSVVFYEEKASINGNRSYCNLERFLRNGIKNRDINFCYLTSVLTPKGMKFDEVKWN